jgi:hypothetical protein
MIIALLDACQPDSNQPPAGGGLRYGPYGLVLGYGLAAYVNTILCVIYYTAAYGRERKSLVE